ncbi:MAG: response regulator [Eubacterium sp.]|nr:response regulator [Eubacterium sp.]
MAEENMEQEIVQNKVAIISAADSFLAKSLISKFESNDIDTVFLHANIKDIEDQIDDIMLMILYMSDGIEENTETLVYLKDIVSDRETGLILIGELDQYNVVKKIIPEHNILECYMRPLDIDLLLKNVNTYLENNTGENRKKEILIVDDDLTYMWTVREWLSEKYHVRMANNGVQAISQLTKSKADLVLLDYEMPIANGPQVLSMLRNDTDTGHIPVMFLTSHGDVESVLSVVGLEPADYLLKTIDKDGLLDKLEKFFNKK